MFDSDIIKIVLRVLAMLMLVLTILTSRVIKARTLICIFMLIIAFLLNLNPIAINLLFLLLMLESIQKMRIMDVARALLISSSAVVILHQFSYMLGLLNVTTTEISERSRSALGFSNANQLAAIYLSQALCALFYYINYKCRRSLIILLGSLAICVPVLQISDSRTSMLALALAILLQVMSKALDGFPPILKALRLLAISSPMLMSFATLFLLTIPIGSALDILLSFRPYFFQEFIKNVRPYEFMLGWATPENIGVDSTYLMLASGVGVILSAMIVIIISVRMIVMRRDFLPIAVVLLISGGVESTLVRPELPAALLFLVVIFAPPVLPQLRREADDTARSVHQ